MNENRSYPNSHTCQGNLSKPVVMFWESPNRHRIRALMLGAMAIMVFSGTASSAPVLSDTTIISHLENSMATPTQKAGPAGGTDFVVPLGTLIEIEITDSISSKTANIGDTFSIRLAESVVMDDRLVLPVGTTGRGEVTHVARAGFGGRPGELILMVRYLQCGAERIPLGHLHFDATGKAHLGAAFAANMVVPLAGLLISGDEVLVQAGTHANARTTKDTTLATETQRRCAPQ
jgi:hypothetical protein